MIEAMLSDIDGSERLWGLPPCLHEPHGHGRDAVLDRQAQCNAKLSHELL